MCGGCVIPAQLEGGEQQYFGKCDFCGTTSTLPKVNDERKANLYNRANHYRRQNEFDKAIQAYENILNEDSSDAEAHWGIVLSRYGIEYVEDPSSGQRIPTCHRVQSESILSDVDFKATLEHAYDAYTRSLYEEEGKKIAEIQKGILAISNKEEPYDVFICYKETTDAGTRTKDSTIAQDIYYQLTKDGYKVFFSRITLEDKRGQQYEPYIFSALNSAKVMLAICTEKEYIVSTWVKNEWSRYFAFSKKDSTRLLIPCYKDIDPYDDLPSELSALQGFDMSKVGFMHDLTHTVKKIVGVMSSSQEIKGHTEMSPTVAPGVESLMKGGWLFLEDSDWKKANDYFDRVFDIDPEYAPLYIGKLCAELKLRHENDLSKHATPLDDMTIYNKAVRFADEKYKDTIIGYNKSILDRIQKEKERSLLDHYNKLVCRKHKTFTENEFLELVKDFLAMNGYKDTEELAKECDKEYQEIKKEREEKEKLIKYKTLLDDKQYASNSKEYRCLAYAFRAMNGYKDTEELATECENKYQELEDRDEQNRFDQYNALLKTKQNASTPQEFSSLASLFRAMNGYKNTEALAKECDSNFKKLDDLRIQKEQSKQRRKKYSMRIISFVVSIISIILLGMSFDHYEYFINFLDAILVMTIFLGPGYLILHLLKWVSCFIMILRWLSLIVIIITSTYASIQSIPDHIGWISLIISAIAIFLVIKYPLIEREQGAFWD